MEETDVATSRNKEHLSRMGMLNGELGLNIRGTESKGGLLDTREMQR